MPPRAGNHPRLLRPPATRPSRPRGLAFPAGAHYDACVFLAGDVGGTKTHLALYRRGDSPRAPALDRKFVSRDYPSLEALIGEFLAGAPDRPQAIALGIAGPVVENRTETTNLPWRVDGTALAAAHGGARVTLLNDPPRAASSCCCRETSRCSSAARPPPAAAR